jgi:hypothetical protein
MHVVLRLMLSGGAVESVGLDVSEDSFRLKYSCSAGVQSVASWCASLNAA